MDVPAKVSLISKMWQDVVNISPREKRTKNDGKSTIIQYIVTITMIENYLQNINYDILPFDKKEAFHLISVFHIYYISTIG